ncbi:MAG: hypothetical protein ACOYLO_19380 [Ferruginibacter sp.]
MKSLKTMLNQGFTYNGKPYRFKKVAENYRGVIKRIPGVLAVVGVNFFKDSFRRQGWLDKRTENWKKRAPGAKRNKGRAILISSGRLRNAIRIAEKSFSRVVIANNVPYALAHNDGFKGTVTVKAHTRGKYKRVSERYKTKAGNERTRSRKEQSATYQVRSHTRKMNMPQRQFMGDSAVLTRKIEKTIDLAVMHIFN